MMNVKAACGFQFIIHHSAFIVSSKHPVAVSVRREQHGTRLRRRLGGKRRALWHSPAELGEKHWRHRRPSTCIASFKVNAPGVQILAALRAPCGGPAERACRAPASRYTTL